MIFRFKRARHQGVQHPFFLRRRRETRLRFTTLRPRTHLTTERRVRFTTFFKRLTTRLMRRRWKRRKSSHRRTRTVPGFRYRHDPSRPKPCRPLGRQGRAESPESATPTATQAFSTLAVKRHRAVAELVRVRFMIHLLRKSFTGIRLVVWGFLVAESFRVI